MKKYKNILLVSGILILVIVLTVLLVLTPSKPGQYDDFASCIKDSGALFYGAFWCPVCQEQKSLFGRSAAKLPYVECSTPDGRNQLQSCNQLNIKSYPTWQFPNEERITGLISLEQLSEKTDCSITEPVNPEA